MKDFVYLNDLFDLYGELLTEKQQTYFKEYYFNNLSYGEIGEKYGTSRNAIFNQIKLINEKLNFFEKKLNLYSKKQTINDIIKIESNEKIKRILENLL